jgi:hypothetical protein
MLYHRDAPARRSQRWRWNIVAPDRRRDRRDEYTSEILAECDEDLKRFGRSNEMRIRQKMADFVKCWQSGMIVGEFPSGFDYTDLKGHDCKEFGIRQIWVTRDYRTAFVIVEDDDPRVVFLTAYIKSKQPVGIQTAVRRVRKYFESEERDA